MSVLASLTAMAVRARCRRWTQRTCWDGRTDGRKIDHLDGSEATETVTFGLDSTTYEIDLNKKNAAALRKALEPHVKAAARDAQQADAARPPRSDRPQGAT